MFNNRILAIIILMISVSSIKMTLYLTNKDGPKCLYQTLTLNEKYSFNVKSYGNQQYTIALLQQKGENDMNELFYKNTKKSQQTYSKMAAVAGSHMFCVSNTEDQTLKLEVEIMTSLQLANYQHLPDLNDQQTVNQQIEWLINQKDKLFEALNRMQDLRLSSAYLSGMMSTKLIVFAILGLVCIVVVNYIFYVQAKKTLKDRKLI